MVHDLFPLVQVVLREYTLPWDGDHGVAHWARVLENGLRLAEMTGANVEVVRHFALIHDSRRVNEVSDPDHGPRAAAFAHGLRGVLLQLSDADFRLLHRACEGHTHEISHPNVTIQTCWDADRLDLGRVGVTPHASRLGTAAARSREVLAWADGRATFGVVPDWVATDWRIDLRGPGWARSGR